MPPRKLWCEQQKKTKKTFPPPLLGQEAQSHGGGGQPLPPSRPQGCGGALGHPGLLRCCGQGLWHMQWVHIALSAIFTVRVPGTRHSKYPHFLTWLNTSSLEKIRKPYPYLCSFPGPGHPPGLLCLVVQLVISPNLMPFPGHGGGTWPVHWSLPTSGAQPADPREQSPFPG